MATHLDNMEKSWEFASNREKSAKIEILGNVCLPVVFYYYRAACNADAV